MVTTLEYNLGRHYIVTRLIDRWAVHQSPNVQHIIIFGHEKIELVHRGGGRRGGGSIVAYVCEQVSNRNPSKALTFIEMESVLEFNETLDAAEGAAWRSYGHQRNIDKGILRMP
jgi:hypothetical protein